LTAETGNFQATNNRRTVNKLLTL